MLRTYSETEVRSLMYALNPEDDKIMELLQGPLGQGTKIPLPWSGSVSVSNCQGLRVNHNLFTQCTNSKKEGDYCTTCAKSSRNNKDTPGVPSAGNVDLRLRCAEGKYTVTINGTIREETPYKVIVEKLKLTENHVRSVAHTFNVALPEDSFEQIGKTKSVTCVVEERPADTNIVTALMNTAVAPPPTRTAIAKSPVSELKVWCQSYAIKIGTKKEMQERLRAELGYTKPSSPSPDVKAPLSTETTSNAPVEEVVEEVVEEGVDEGVETLDVLERDATTSIEELSEEEYEEEEQVCDLFTDPTTGFQYLKGEGDELFDKVTKREVGTLFKEKVVLYADIQGDA